MFIKRVAKTDIKKSRIPNVKDIIDAKKKKIYEDLSGILEEKVDSTYFSWAKNMLEDKNPTDILAAVLNYCFEDELNPESYGSVKEFGSKSDPVDKKGKARLFVSLGKKDKLNPKKLVELITSKVQLKSKQISDVQVMEKFSFITVPFDKAEQVVLSFKEKGQRPIISHAKR
jgi:ATP-dependent RNA helicase DeaD